MKAKSCPMCGSDHIRTKSGDPVNSRARECCCCRHQGPDGVTDCDATAKWNEQVVR